jgi:peptidyl-prolyl cis-trans isomerase SurA
MCSQNLAYRLITTIAAFVFCFIYSTSIFAATLDGIVAKVNADVITLGALEKRVEIFLRQKQSSGSVDEKLTKNNLMKTVLDQIITEKLQIHEAKKIGMVVSDEDIQKRLDEVYKNNKITHEMFESMLVNEGTSLDSYKELIGDQIYVSRVVQMQLGTSTPLREKSLRNYYRKNKKDFFVSEKVELSQIMLVKEKGASNKEIQMLKMKADKIFELIKGGDRFADVARKFSNDVSAHSGGKIGVVSRGTMLPELENAAFDLREGDVSQLVETINGLHIIKCDSFIPAHAKGYKSVKSEIEKILRIQKREEKYHKWIKGLKEKSFIQISLDLKGKNVKSIRNPNSIRKKKVAQSPEFAKPDQYTKKQKKNINHENPSNNRWIVNKLKKYKELYAKGEISKKLYLIKKKQLLEKL